MKNERFLAILLTVAMLIGSIPVTMFTAGVTEGTPIEELEPGEYPEEWEYDFTIPGSTISFLDKDGELLTEEVPWIDSEAVVEKWYVFMYRQSGDDLKLGYSTEGQLFIPHKVYEGDTADLLYVKDNNMFRVSATKVAEQIFDGSDLLKEVIVKVTGENVTLANAPVYAETPFTFVYMGNTDENGDFSINSTLGEFKLWVASNQGYIVGKTVTVAENTTEISFADVIENAVKVDITGRADAVPEGPGYVVAIGKPYETDETNMLTTSYLSPEKTVWITPGDYRVASIVSVLDQYEYSRYGEYEYRGLWIDLADSIGISQNTVFDFSLDGFEGKLSSGIDGELVCPGDELSLTLYAEDGNGYVIPGDAGSYWYTKDRVVVTVGEEEYPYTFETDPFSMLYEPYIYSIDDEETILYQQSDAEYPFEIPYYLFEDTVKDYVVKYYSEYDSRVFPDLFPEGEYYSASFRTQVASEDTFRIIKTEDYIPYLYYLDEDGEQQDAKCYFGVDAYYYLLPACVGNGDGIVFVTYDWGEGITDYNVVDVSDELFESIYVFVPHSEFSKPVFNVMNSTEPGRGYKTEVTASFSVGDGCIRLSDFDVPMGLPYDEYVFSVTALCEFFNEETWELSHIDFISYEQEYVLSEEAYYFDIDCVDYESFCMDTSAFFSNNHWYNDGYRKEFTLYFADGTIRNIPWNTAPMWVYIDTMPEYASGELYYYGTMEMYPFSPYVSYEKFEIEEGRTYRFDFTPDGIEFVGESTFASTQNVVLNYQVTDGFGQVMDDAWNLLNQFAVHDPLRSKEYPFRDNTGAPVDNQYTIDVYYRLIGTDEYTKVSFTDYAEADLGLLGVGEYEGYIELNLDTYRDEYLVEYPMEKDPNRDEYSTEFTGVYDNIDRILHGVFRDVFAFTVVGESHTCDFGDWEDDGNGTSHTRTCGDPECGMTETLSHDWDEGVQVGTPTCTEGARTVYTCVDCDATYEEGVDSLDHDWTEWTDDGEDGPADTHSRTCKRDCGVAAETESHGWGDWTSIDGENHKKTCLVCNGTRTAPHDFDSGVITEPETHTSKGVMTFTCGDCGYSYTEDIPETTGHEWSDWYPDQDGTHSRTCRCNASETEGCDYDAGVVTKEPTHIEQGTMLYTCIVCESTYEEDILALTGHTWGEWVENKADSTTHIRFCICNDSETAPHDFDAGVVTRVATHTSKGVMTFTCGDCGYSYTEDIPETTGHEWSDWYPNQDGTHSRTCRCNASETEGCDYDEGVVTKESTHIEHGTKLYTCTVCESTYEEDVPVLTGHTWGDWVENKTDSTTHIRFCICNDSETAPHDFDAGVVTKEATHLEAGIETFTCNVCGYSYTEDVPKITDHEWSDWIMKDDAIHIRECICGDAETKDHDFDAGVVTKEATHLEAGIETFTCNVCGFVREDTIAKTIDHSFGEWEPEATVVGKHYRDCACGEREYGDCSYGAGVVTIEPTYESTGTMTYTCTVCSGTKTETLDMLVKAEEIVSPDNSDVRITAPEGSTAVLYENTVLQVEEVREEISEDVKANVVEVVGGSDGTEVLVTYDISLVLYGATVQPGGKVEVTLPAPENAGDFDTLLVVFIDDEGNVTPCETRVNADGTITFVTDHFSHYAIVGVENSSPVVWALISVISIALIASAAVLAIKKRNGIA